MASNRAVALWLLGVAALVFAMVVLGGATRLTQSGLSMVDWRPLMGVIPPLGEPAWREVFQQYQAFPEYQQINRGMSLAEFKTIFWFEYAHRLLGRGIGLAFLLPFGWFLARRRLAPALACKLGAIFLLGGLQGLVGWWMVKSGLVDDPDVSQYRLAVHLSLALLIFVGLCWLAVGLEAASTRRGPSFLGLIAGGAVLLQAFSGALVAGLDAGRHYNTFPTMNGVWFPTELLHLDPWWLNAFENATTVQFDHRLGAVAASLLVALFGLRCIARGGRARAAGFWLLAALAAQFALGVATLVMMVPVALGVSHQAGALLLLAAWIVAYERLTRPPA